MELAEQSMKFKAKLKRGDVCLGLIMTFSDPSVAECLAMGGLDYLTVDLEHAPNDCALVQSVSMALKGTGCIPIVRPSANDEVLIKRVLDAGAAGVLLPWVRSVKDVEYSVAACKYPPVGVRGYGPRRLHHYGRMEAEYLKTANDQTLVMVQIEDIAAVNCIEDIVKVQGLDGIFVGANDLAGSMGLLGQRKHPRVLEAINRVLVAGEAAGMPVGIATSDNPEDALAYVRAGFRILGLPSDYRFLARGVDRLAGDIRAGLA